MDGGYALILKDSSVHGKIWELAKQLITGRKGLAKYHIDSIQEWESFSHKGDEYCLGHLKAHEVEFVGKDGTSYKFIVTYGLHCFTKNETAHNIPVLISDGREQQYVCLERYESSKKIRQVIESLDQPRVKIYQTFGEKFFTMHLLNNLTGELEPYKICVAFFRENRKLRLHVTSAFFAREGEGSPSKPITRNGFSVFKIAKDIVSRPKNKSAGPKEARNRRSRQ